MVRADARRNRDKLLAVARETFASEGLAIPMEELARRAGVGVGTLYRHFPTKERLYAAILEERIVDAAGRARLLAAAPDPGAAFFGFLDEMWRDGAAKRDLAAALGDVRAAVADASAQLRRALATLLRRAQESGAVRDDVRVADILALLAAAMEAARRSPGSRLYAVVRDGLRGR